MRPYSKEHLQKQTVWMSHGDLVTEIAPGFEKVGTSNDCPIASIEDANRKFYGVQFQKFVIQNMVTTYYVILLLMCVAVLVTGAWKTSSIWKSLKSVNK